jgi:hypothetical protein
MSSMMIEMFAFMKSSGNIYNNLVGFEEKKPLNDVAKIWMNEDSMGAIRIVHSLDFDHFFLEVWIFKT